ncbi:MAG: hypothetical protein WA066_03070 [Candidatus Omnitrophota bacterium]
MALNAAITCEFRSTAAANMVNGGGFRTGGSGTDYSKQDAAQWTATDLTCAANATNIVSAASTFTTAAVGNVIHLTALTGTGAKVGWYEITAYVNANTLTLDRTPTDGTNAITAGTFYIGGALNVGGSLEDDFFEEISGANAEDGISVYFYNNNSTSTVTFTPSEAIAIAGAGGTLAPIKIIGYKTTRGDNPTGASRPTIAMGANPLTWGTNFEIYNLIFTGTAANSINIGINGKLVNCKSTNLSTTINRNSIAMYNPSYVFNSGSISYNGNAITYGDIIGHIIGCYIHDSGVGIFSSAIGSKVTILNNIIESCFTASIQFTGAQIGTNVIYGNTFYGSENTTGIGVSLAAGITDIKIMNNIFYGFATGVSHGTAGQTVGYDDYNDYFNNDTDVSNWTKGSNDQAVNPTFTNVAQVTGTTGTYAGTTLTDAGKFGSVVAGRDYIYIISGTGMTAGIYGISSATANTVVTDLDAGENVAGDVVYQITIGRNFAVGTNLKALGFPGAFQAGLSTGYMDIGAVQRQEPAGGGGLLVHSGMTGGMRG